MKKILLITPPQYHDFDGSVLDGLGVWKKNIIDRDALVLGNFLKQYLKIHVTYLPLNSLFPFWNTTSQEQTYNEILNIEFDTIIIVNQYFCECQSFRILDHILIKLADKGLCFNLIYIGQIYNSQHPDLIHENIKNCFFSSLHSFYEANRMNNISTIDIIPDYNLLKPYIKKLTRDGKSKITLALRTEVGCPNKCLFCSTNNGLLDYGKNLISPESFENELILISQVIGFDKVDFDCILDDSFGHNENHAKKILNLLKKYNIHVKYILMNVRSIINSSLMGSISEISEYLLMGVENYNDKILESINKKQSFRDVIEAIVICKNHGIKVHLNWILGLPGDNIDNLWINLKVIAFLLYHNLADEIEPQILMIFPWTKIYSCIDKYGISLIDKEYSKYDEQGYISKISYESLSSSQIERAMMLYQLYIYKYKELKKKKSIYELTTYNPKTIDTILHDINIFSNSANKNLFSEIISI